MLCTALLSLLIATIAQCTLNPKSISSFVNPVGTQQQYVRGCYFTNWSKYRPGRGKYSPDDYLPGLCTHILFAFGWVNENNYTIRAYDEADLTTPWSMGQFELVNRLKEQDPNLKTLLSVGGWTFGTTLFKALSQTPQRRAAFIESAVTFVRQYGFDGLDIDWEYPDAEDYKNYVSLMIELRARFDLEAQETRRERLLLTAAVSAAAEKIKAGYNVTAITPLLDYIFVMAYDFHGGWESYTGHHAPLFSRDGETDWLKKWNVNGAATVWEQLGMTKSKIIIGIGTYGRGWTLTKADPNSGMNTTATGVANATPYVREGGVASWYELCEMLAKPMTVRHWHSEYQVPWLVDGNQWWGYDDKQSITNKMQWLKGRQFGGAFVWTLDFDDFDGGCPDSTEKYPLISTIARELAGINSFGTLQPFTTTTSSWWPTTQPVTQTPSVIPPTSSAAPIVTTIGSDSACQSVLTGFVPHPDVDRDSTQCRRAVVCYEGKIGGYIQCPDGFDFSPKKSVCMPEKVAQCRKSEPVESTTTSVAATTVATTHMPTTTGTEFVCSSEGFFADPVSCSHFYRCFSGKAHLFTCPGPLYYDEKTNVCVDRSMSKCKQDDIDILRKLMRHDE